MPCISPSKPSLGHQHFPITVHISEDSQASQHPPEPAPPNQADELIIFDQNGRPVQYERMKSLRNTPLFQLGAAQVLLPQGQLLDITHTPNKVSRDELQTVALTAIADSTSNYVVPMQPVSTVAKNPALRWVSPCLMPLQLLPPSTPAWAQRLRNCEKIGDSYRGYCTSEAELEAVLTMHKQQTQSVWGTRQSPSPAKPATRLMWKSQYVPYDGIPFVNAGKGVCSYHAFSVNTSSTRLLVQLEMCHRYYIINILVKRKNN
uniref:Uncharacterized protein n=1 Tax=Lepisosteus oculatus TaxID=7918 RepID=W5MVV4_LEPOC